MGLKVNTAENMSTPPGHTGTRPCTRNRYPSHLSWASSGGGQRLLAYEWVPVQPTCQQRIHPSPGWLCACRVAVASSGCPGLPCCLSLVARRCSNSQGGDPRTPEVLRRALPCARRKQPGAGTQALPPRGP